MTGAYIAARRETQHPASSFAKRAFVNSRALVKCLLRVRNKTS